MKLTAAYFASGITPMNLSSWGLENLILIDNGFLKTEMNGNIWKLKCDAIEAVDILREKGIKLDVYISINEGLNEGGGKYPLNGQYFLGYLMQILQPNYFHIYAPNYYRQAQPYFLSHHLPDLPYKKNNVNSSDIGFDFSLLNNSGNYEVKIFKMERKLEQAKVHPLFSNISIERKSIWEEAKNLNKILITETKMLSYLKYYFHKICPFTKGEFPFEQMNQQNLNSGDTIGIVPWSSLNYPKELLQLNLWAKAKNITIKIFYLESKDQIKLLS